MTLLLALPAAVLGLLAAVLVLPFDVRVVGAVRDGEPDGEVRIRWAAGLISVRLGPGGARVAVLGLPAWRPGRRAAASAARRPPRRRDDAPSDRRAEPSRPRPAERLRAALRHRGPLGAMGRRLLAAAHPRLRLSGRVGAGDPVETAAVAAALRALARAPGVAVDVELDWLDEVLELSARGTARVWGIEVLAVGVGLLAVKRHRAALRAVLDGT